MSFIFNLNVPVVAGCVILLAIIIMMVVWVVKSVRNRARGGNFYDVLSTEFSNAAKELGVPADNGKVTTIDLADATPETEDVKPVKKDAKPRTVKKDKVKVVSPKKPKVLKVVVIPDKKAVTKKPVKTTAVKKLATVKKPATVKKVTTTKKPTTTKAKKK
jgi:outer membrane biosynthesis protein TonB